MIQSLYNAICLMVPVKRYGLDEDYRTVLNGRFKDYLSLLMVDLEHKLITEEDYEDIKKICGKLNDIIKTSYQGLHSTAFTKLSNLLRSDETPTSFGYCIKMCSIKPYEKSFYRMRILENRRDVSYMDMFHIPLNQRGIVNTNRFSAPGYPCLYLGTSIYACWEELGRPPMSQSMVSRLANSSDLHLIDLRLPSYEEFIESMTEYLRVIPLILACSVMVKDTDAHFKPEYILPQLLMEYVINLNVNLKMNPAIAGICYTSVFKNDDFGFPREKFENIAIPVQTPFSKRKYCPKLCEIFTITKPTCDELEQARSGGYSTMGYNQETSAIEYRQGMVGGYDYSSFGYLEKRLGDTRLFPLQRILA